jgi:membrane protease YdiL (CAAX protease family)
MTTAQWNEATDPVATFETVPGRRLARALTGWIGVSAVVGVATFVAGRAIVPAPADPTKALTAISVFEVYALLVVSLYLPLGRHGDLRKRLRVRFTTVGDLALVVGVGALCWGAVVVVFFAIGALGALGDSLIWLGSDGGRLGSIDPVTTSLSLLRACVLAPIGEELLFRGALFGWLRGRAGAWPTIFVSAVLFGAVHILPILMPVGFALGLGLGWVRERTGSVLPGIFFHIAHNTALFAVVYVLAGWH